MVAAANELVDGRKGEGSDELREQPCVDGVCCYIAVNIHALPKMEEECTHRPQPSL